MRSIILAASLIAALMSPHPAVAAADDAAAAQARVTTLLGFYAKKDVADFMRMLDPQAAMYGTALKEFYTTPTGIASLLASDYRQWNSSSFGVLQNVTMHESGDLQTVFFDAPFTIVTADGHTQSFTIRFATVWHRSAGAWLLVQSTNAVVQ